MGRGSVRALRIVSAAINAIPVHQLPSYGLTLSVLELQQMMAEGLMQLDAAFKEVEDHGGLVQEQPKARDNVCKASNEVEPKNEGNDVAGGSSFFCAAKQGLPANDNRDDAECDRDESQYSRPTRMSECCLVHDLCLCCRERYCESATPSATSGSCHNRISRQTTPAIYADATEFCTTREESLYQRVIEICARAP